MAKPVFAAMPSHAIGKKIVPFAAWCLHGASMIRLGWPYVLRPEQIASHRRQARADRHRRLKRIRAMASLGQTHVNYIPRVRRRQSVAHADAGVEFVA
jgi:hypothetical protein